jgi:hypothetical protein
VQVRTPTGKIVAAGAAAVAAGKAAAARATDAARIRTRKATAGGGDAKVSRRPSFLPASFTITVCLASASPSLTLHWHTLRPRMAWAAAPGRLGAGKRSSAHLLGCRAAAAARVQCFFHALEPPLQVPAWSFALVVVVVALISVVAALLALRSNRRGSHM